MATANDTSSSLTTTVIFTRKSICSHLFDFFKGIVGILISAAVAFSVLIVFLEAEWKFTETAPNRRAYALLFVVSLLLSLIWNVWLYLNRIPDGLENIARSTARIAHLRHPRWQFRFAQKLLAEMLGPMDRELRDLAAGNCYVISVKPESFEVYFHWLQTRVPNLESMLAIARKVIIHEFPKTLSSSEEKPVEPRDVLYSANTLARLYGETVAFERSLRAVMPSEATKNLHELMYNWSDPIRDAIHQVFVWLQKIIDCKPNEFVPFTITFGEPPHSNEFDQELQRLNNPEDLIRLRTEWWGS